MLHDIPSGSTINGIVSILTRPGGRVLPSLGALGTLRAQVSILTRPGGRVLRPCSLQRLQGLCRFNPHPTRRPGATRSRSPIRRPLSRFNPHPTRRPGATFVLNGGVFSISGVSILTRPGGRVLLNLAYIVSKVGMFQSSPDPEAGCYLANSTHPIFFPMFQSSPDPEAGCYRSCY